MLVNDTSDHLPICVKINRKTYAKMKSLSKYLKFDFRKIETLKQNLSLRLSDFHKLMEAESASSMLLSTLSKEIEDLSIKTVNRRTVPIQPWISFSLLRCINRKKNIYIKSSYILQVSLTIRYLKTIAMPSTNLLRLPKCSIFNVKLVRSNPIPKNSGKCF